MPKIRLLDEDTINKIAAGEVIERPASVVKELVENSIDAGAKRVLIEVTDGGKSLVKVTDDGCGIEPDDLTLAFQKHTTSKISEAVDLERISTLGFRGEALASIAAVSRSVEVYTKTEASQTGNRLDMAGGRTAEIKEAGCPRGTSIAVRDLFYNIPARRKHLRGSEAELVHITDLITEMAIVHHDISFELFTGRRTLFKSAASQSWDGVLLRVFGLKAVKSMVPLQAEGRGWRLCGVAGDPLTTRSSPDRIFIYVNGRAVSSKSLAAALREAYRNMIPVGRSPMAVVSMEISPDLVDVNVHPSKREIRLLREEEISGALQRAVSEALQAHGSAHPCEVPLPREPPAKAAIAPSGSNQRTLPLQICGEEEVEAPVTVDDKPQLKILGQVLDLYIVAEGEAGLMLIDQHAAAERIRFERLRELFCQRNIRQELAEPLAIDLSPSEQILMGSWEETLREIGFEIAPFGGNTYTVRAVPALGKRLESAEAVHDILRDLFSRGKVAPESMNRDDILKLLACKGSIKSGKVLEMDEMRRLLEDLYLCQDPLTCPHGRPVMIVIDQGQLERLFARR
ncbi:MAG: DNA mismatch repair protein [Methanosaeta sp. PtaU1.Bin060]|nr:MAG: DNA mismatch repair protein [Methanosaeta sp. PtaU1.Bin060]